MHWEKKLPVFIAALLTIAKMWMHIYTMAYYRAVEKNEIIPLIATWMA